MSINIIKEEIDILIDTIREQHNIVKEYKGRIPQIELDIVMSNVRDLYEYLNELNKINNLRRTQQPIEVSTEILEKIAHTKKEKTTVEINEVVQEPIIEKEVVPTETIEVPLVEVLTPELDSIVEEPQSFVEKEEVAEVNTPEEVIIAPAEEEIKPETDNVVIAEALEEIIIEVEELKEPEPKKELKKPSKSEKPAIMDMFADSEKTSLSDKFKDEKKSLADKIQKKPIKDLKTAIGINDKFIFINELFKGSLQEYNQAIETINAYNSDKEAFLFIEELKVKYNWQEKADVYVKLEEFVLRKFL